MSDPRFNVLFLCTGNSARSIMAEAILNRDAAGRFRAYSAGSFPKGEVNAQAIRLLDSLGYQTSGFRSKSWDEFSGPGAPEMHFVFTVCDDAAEESCPVWPGHPITAHWGVPDPAAATGTAAEIALAFHDAYRMLERRISCFTALPLASLGKMALKAELRRIGQLDGATARARAG
jgi:arsenate reductase